MLHYAAQPGECFQNVFQIQMHWIGPKNRKIKKGPKKWKICKFYIKFIMQPNLTKCSQYLFPISWIGPKNWKIKKVPKNRVIRKFYITFIIQPKIVTCSQNLFSIQIPWIGPKNRKIKKAQNNRQACKFHINCIMQLNPCPQNVFPIPIGLDKAQNCKIQKKSLKSEIEIIMQANMSREVGICPDFTIHSLDRAQKLKN